MTFPAFSNGAEEKAKLCVLCKFVFGDIQFDWALCKVICRSWEVLHHSSGQLTADWYVDWITKAEEMFSFLKVLVLMIF